MAAQFNITKTSGVVMITSTASDSLPKSYFGSVGNFSPNGNYINLNIGTDNYQFLYTDFSVNGQSPSTLNTALTLLNSILGT